MTLDDCLFALIVAVFVFAQPAIWAYKIYQERKNSKMER